MTATTTQQQHVESSNSVRNNVESSTRQQQNKFTTAKQNNLEVFTTQWQGAQLDTETRAMHMTYWDNSRGQDKRKGNVRTYRTLATTANENNDSHYIHP